jgi:hypothetical protein
MGNYSSIDGVYYCTPHYKMLVTTNAGNLDDLSGKEPRKPRNTEPVTAPSCKC